VAKQRTLDKAIGAIYEVLAEGIGLYPDDEKTLRAAIAILQKTPARG
jgi:hypothetical protein